ncbi:IS66 family transposase, partial [Salmonella enterica subsp. enterica]|nr:IS66 family transposase [Salmonella enterica subsp. enterica serovar Java]
RAHLKRFSGILQADGYAGFAQLYATGTIEEAACWAHARRKFYEVYKDLASPLAAEALQRIAALYAIESEIRGQPPNLRKVVRQSRASPLLEQLHAWLNQTLTQLSKKSALGGAILYALNRWQALVRYCDDGRIEIDN